MKKLSFETKRNLKNIGIVVTLFGTLSFYGFNCAPPSFSTSEDGSQSIVTGGQLDEFDIPVPLDQKTDVPFALLTVEQVFQSIVNLTGQTNYPNNLVTEFNIRSGAFSVTPDLKFVNSPMLIALTSLSGEACNGLVTAEQAIAYNGGTNTRRFFNMVDFAATISTFDQARLSDVVSKMSNAFWGRAPSSEELALYTTYRTDFVSTAPANTAAQTRALVLSLCTSMLSAMDTFTY